MTGSQLQGLDQKSLEPEFHLAVNSNTLLPPASKYQARRALACTLQEMPGRSQFNLLYSGEPRASSGRKLKLV